MCLMLKWIYNIGFSLAFILTWPWFALRMQRRGNFWHGFSERFSFYSPELKIKLARLKNPVWIHAVSVGEMMLARVLVDELRLLHAQQDVVITCTTSTGRALGERELADEHTLIIYSPADLLPMARRAFAAIRPSIILLIEQELWPNQLWEAQRQEVPVWIINARLSDRSWARFKKFRNLLSPVLAQLSFVGLQSPRDRSRFAQAGFPVHCLFCTGSMKFDVADLAELDHGVAQKLRSEMSWSLDEEVFLAGSTHPGEEKLILDSFLNLKKTNPNLKLLLAPRHAERAKSLVEFVQSYNVTVCLRSQPEAACSVLILDSTGELRSLYEIGTVVFVGKSLAAPRGKGGQNFLEAARAGVPIIIGDKVENFRTLVEDFLERDALIQVKNGEELEKETLRLLQDASLRKAYGERGRKLFLEQVGAGARVAKMVESFLVTIR